LIEATGCTFETAGLVERVFLGRIHQNVFFDGHLFIGSLFEEARSWTRIFTSACLSGVYWLVFGVWD